jgi:hypothetical protein
MRGGGVVNGNRGCLLLYGPKGGGERQWPVASVSLKVINAINDQRVYGWC